MTKQTVEPVQIPAHVAAAIIAHAREGTPEEVCGILRGRGRTAFEAFRSRNVAAERIENYIVDPQTLLLQFEFEDNGDEMMGVYHSHPVSDAYPSATDAWNAHYPDSIYFICSLENDEAPIIRSYRMTPHFMDLDVSKLQNVLDFDETRTDLFAYYQPANKPTPAILQEAAEIATPPFYVVYSAPSQGDTEPESRVVSIVEHPVVVE